MTTPPQVGRPCGCTLELVGMLRGLIREQGLSDSAAARRLGIGASTLSRWKRADPEVRALLQQAREECRAVQLQNIMQAAAAEHGRGWRAAAWLLERLFPEDYMRDAGAREGHRSVAEAREGREEQAEEERAERVRAASRQQERASVEAFAQEEDCRNCRNSGESAGVFEAAQDLAGVAQCFQPVGGSGGCGGAELSGGEEVAFTQERDCRNCRNLASEVFEEADALETNGDGCSQSSSGSPPREAQLRPQGHDQVQLGHEEGAKRVGCFNSPAREPLPGTQAA